ncbi:syndecan-4 isoform X1 [Hippoglossus stenolepis]|uniref:syndecan-4 isoform X1 n=1 Tax=Hippoglossus stenolepis TaxID=195615 RepID=UPI00159C1E34|nr:syndecan-4 isoform X1 [Hippoglossus stenolepis]
MLRLLLLFLLSASVCTESQVRETETWMPMKTTQTVAMSTHSDGLEASGDAQNGSDFGFTDDEDDEDDTDLTYEYDESSGSGDGAATVSPERDSEPSVKPDANDNKIPEAELPVRPTVNEVEQDSNEIPLVRKDPETSEEYPSNVLMAHASDDSIFNKTEVLAAVIAGCAVGLMFAVLLILLLIYRMKKKDEGSYDLGKKPIYKKAPTTEIYA